MVDFSKMDGYTAFINEFLYFLMTYETRNEIDDYGPKKFIIKMI